MRYLLEFEKKGELRYLSHLDNMRLFQRMFRRAEIELAHSQGFNPHPKLVLAAPLSLGFETEGDLLDFETPPGISEEPDELLARLHAAAPPGLRLLCCEPLPPDQKKPLASQIRAAEYRVEWRPSGPSEPLPDWPALIRAFLAQPEI